MFHVYRGELIFFTVYYYLVELYDKVNYTLFKIRRGVSQLLKLMVFKSCFTNNDIFILGKVTLYYSNKIFKCS